LHGNSDIGQVPLHFTTVYCVGPRHKLPD